MNTLLFQELEKFVTINRESQINKLNSEIDNFLKDDVDFEDEDTAEYFIDRCEGILISKYKNGDYSFLSFDEFYEILCRFEIKVYKGNRN